MLPLKNYAVSSADRALMQRRLPLSVDADALAAAIRELATAVNAQTEVNRVILAAMPARVEAEITGKSTRTIHRLRAQRKASSR